MNLLILGFIRPENDYVSKELLIKDIHLDMDVARRSLEQESYLSFKSDEYLGIFDGREHENVTAK